MKISIDIIQKCKKKDRKAEKTLFLRLAPILLTDCRRYARDTAEAKDFLQDAFIRIYDKIELYDCNRGASFETWARTVCRNCILMELRKRKIITSIIPIDSVADIVDEDASDNDEREEERLIDAIQKLPLGYRTVLNLYVFSGYSHEDIGHQLGIGATTSRSQYARAKKLLKKLLTEKKANYAWEEREAL